MSYGAGLVFCVQMGIEFEPWSGTYIYFDLIFLPVTSVTTLPRSPVLHPSDISYKDFKNCQFSSLTNWSYLVNALPTLFVQHYPRPGEVYTMHALIPRCNCHKSYFLPTLSGVLWSHPVQLLVIHLFPYFIPMCLLTPCLWIANLEPARRNKKSLLLWNFS